jgi:hypothetical protein
MANNIDLGQHQRLDDARDLYLRLRKALVEAIDSLESPGGDSADVKQNRMGIVKLHLAQLQRLQDLERDLDKLGRRPAAIELDLDSARQEIRERLAKLRDARRN